MIKKPQRYSYQLMKELITNATGQAKQIGALAYATGSRVSELNKITAGDIQVKDDYLQITCNVLKKRKQKDVTRTAIVRLDETWLIDPINELRKDKAPDEILIPMYRMKIWRILNNELGINPHGFRKIRATNLAQLGYTGHQLKNFFGWSSVAPSDFYVKLNVDDLKYEVK